MAPQAKISIFSCSKSLQKSVFGASKPNKNRLRRLLSSKKSKKTNLGLEPSWGLDLGFQRRRRNSYVNPNSAEPRPYQWNC
jgi:hypothetical protein